MPGDEKNIAGGGYRILLLLFCVRKWFSQGESTFIFSDVFNLRGIFLFPLATPLNQGNVFKLKFCFLDEISMDEAYRLFSRLPNLEFKIKHTLETIRTNDDCVPYDYLVDYAKVSFILFLIFLALDLSTVYKARLPCEYFRH